MNCGKYVSLVRPAGLAYRTPSQRRWGPGHDKSPVTQDQGAEPERRSEGVTRCPVSTRGLAPSRDPWPLQGFDWAAGRGAPPSWSSDRHGQVPSGPDIYRPANGEFRVSRSRDTGGGTVGTGWDRLGPAGTGLAPARRLRHGRRWFRLTRVRFRLGRAPLLPCSAWLGFLRFGSVRLGSARLCPARPRSAPLGSVGPCPAGPSLPSVRQSLQRDPGVFRVPKAAGPRAGAVFGLCIDGGRLVTRLRVLVLVPSRSSLYGKPPLRCLK